MASNELVKLARKAASAARKSQEAHRKWVAQFEREYGHNDISDILVGAVDYGHSDYASITAKFIDDNSLPGCS